MKPLPALLVANTMVWFVPGIVGTLASAARGQGQGAGQRAGLSTRIDKLGGSL